MLQNFIICATSVIPSVIYLTIGIVLKVCKVVTEDEVKRFTRMTFVALYPFMMFDNLYGKNLAESFNVWLVVLAVGFTFFQIASSWGLVSVIEKDSKNRGAMIQGMWRSNIVLMGLPVGIHIFGKACVAPVAIVLLVVVPLYNVMAVILLEIMRGGKANPGKLLKGVFTNPIIIGAIAALVVIGLGIQLPVIVSQTVTTLSDATAPIAMILLGASLKLESISSDRGKLAVVTIGKLVIYPLLGILLAAFLGFRGVELGAILLMVATPTALASFAMASSMGSNGRLAGEIVVFTTIISCVTIPIWLFILMTIGLI
ncbi:MAG: AEC family transporter [Mogibacterium sp.]|nr:AEC family transporter [Mogibacterium sp.]